MYTCNPVFTTSYNKCLALLAVGGIFSDSHAHRGHLRKQQATVVNALTWLVHQRHLEKLDASGHGNTKREFTQAKSHGRQLQGEHRASTSSSSAKYSNESSKPI